MLTVGAVLIGLAFSAATLGGQNVARTDDGLTLLSSSGQRTIPTTTVAGREMVSLAALAEVFDLTIHEDSLAGGLTVARGDQSIVMAPDQNLVSVGGRLVSLPAPAAEGPDGWLVPIEFIGRALSLIHDSPLELRAASRLVISGNLRVPRVIVRQEIAGGRARITIQANPRTATSVQQEAGRLVVSFEADRLDASLPPVEAGDLVEGIGLTDRPTDLAIALGPAFGSYDVEDSSGGAGSTRLRIDIRSARLETSAEPDTATPEFTTPSPLFDRARPALQAVVIDPGHGGDDAGSRGAGGTLEKTVTLGVARRLAAMIESRLGLRVLLTRDSDRTVRLDERAALANNNKADLFISLHANASPRPAVTGAEVFFLSLGEYGEEAASLAASQAPVLPVFGGGRRSIDVVQWELAQLAHLDASTVLARTVADRLADRVPMSERPLQDAPFRVLAGANMPAVLVEMGFMTNADQEAALASGAFQNSVAQALFESVVSFRAYLQNRQRASAPRRPPDADPPAAARAAGAAEVRR